MSDEDEALVHPPRRRINGVNWVFTGAYVLDCNGIAGRWRYALGQDFIQAGYAMGCVKDDVDTREARFCPIDQVRRTERTSRA